MDGVILGQVVMNGAADRYAVRVRVRADTDRYEYVRICLREFVKGDTKTIKYSFIARLIFKRSENPGRLRRDSALARWINRLRGPYEKTPALC